MPAFPRWCGGRNQIKRRAVEQELTSYINGLDEEERANLVALAWVGRETYGTDEWAEALDTARTEHGKRTAQYLLGLPLLGDYLADGLAEFGEDFDDESDEEFDEEVMAAMLAGDEEKLMSFPENYFWGNTCETKSWYPMVAAMNDYGRKMDIIDYVPCYRSEAGTGQAMIFASWN